MKAKVYTADGSVNGTVELPASIFGVEPNNALLHTVIVGYLANRRQGTAKTKSRSEVSGGGKKPWKQKGTGRARSGSNTSPVWTRGGKAHGAQPRDYRHSITRKMRRKALLCAYSVRASEERIGIVSGLNIEQPKTKIVSDLLNKIGVFGNGKTYNGKTLLIISPDNRNIYLSGRNLKDVDVKIVNDVNAYDVVRASNIIFADENLISKIEEMAA
ncbi:MAG: 50S ribosomal protein L4 [Chitinispirillales bacterium]|jgi:large subunit ribosomal protein L4|nr:50S ribosomal protein L4 [Chitinispirillales bacterium]